VAVALGLSPAACGGSVIVVNGIEVYERLWDRAAQQVTQRASFDLQCPAQQLELTLIEKTVREPTAIGVRGCGRQGTYVRPLVGGHLSTQWLLQSQVQ
jgi:hypothetical protein